MLMALEDRSVYITVAADFSLESLMYESPLLFKDIKGKDTQH
jgi:hypothetical protein